MNATNNPDIQNAQKASNNTTPKTITKKVGSESIGSLRRLSDGQEISVRPAKITPVEGFDQGSGEAACVLPPSTPLNQDSLAYKMVTEAKRFMAEVDEAGFTDQKKGLTSPKISAKDTQNTDTTESGGIMSGETHPAGQERPQLTEDNERLTALLQIHMQTITLSQEQEKQLAELKRAIADIGDKGLIANTFPKRHPAVDALLDAVDPMVRRKYFKDKTNQKINY